MLLVAMFGSWRATVKALLVPPTPVRGSQYRGPRNCPGRLVLHISRFQKSENVVVESVKNQPKQILHDCSGTRHEQ